MPIYKEDRGSVSQRFEIFPESIILRGTTTKEGVEGFEYIVFQEDGRIYVTGKKLKDAWERIGKNLCVRNGYVRVLADDIAKFHDMSVGAIDTQAYYAYMDGAR